MRLLFIRFSSMGDIVLTSGILSQVKKQLPDVMIDILTFEEYELLFAVTGVTDRIYSIKRGTPVGEYRKILQIMPQYDYVFDLHDNTRSNIAVKTLKCKSSTYQKQSIKRRFYAMFRLFGNDLNKHVTQKYADAVFPILNLKMPNKEDLRPIYMTSIKPVANKIVIHPFASKATKVWPFFGELSKRLVNAGYDVTVVGHGEIEKVSGVSYILDQPLNLLLEEMASASLVISTDSGPMHLAVAYNRPLIVIFGSTTREFGFFPFFKNCTIIENNEIKCRPCHVHGLPACPKKHFDCMKSISVNKIFATVRTAIKS